jgi:hypothetical protein
MFCTRGALKSELRYHRPQLFSASLRRFRLMAWSENLIRGVADIQRGLPRTELGAARLASRGDTYQITGFPKSCARCSRQFNSPLKASKACRTAPVLFSTPAIRSLRYFKPPKAQSINPFKLRATICQAVHTATHAEPVSYHTQQRYASCISTTSLRRIVRSYGQFEAQPSISAKLEVSGQYNGQPPPSAVPRRGTSCVEHLRQ